MAKYKNSMEQYWDNLSLLDRKVLLVMYGLNTYSDQYDKMFRRLNGKLKVDLYHYWLRSIRHDTKNMGKTEEERAEALKDLEAENKAKQEKRDAIAATSAKVNAPRSTALKTKVMIKEDKIKAALANEAKKAKARAKYAEKTKEAKAAKARNRAKVATREAAKLDPIPVPIPIEAAENPLKEKVDRMTKHDIACIERWENLKRGNPLQIAVIVNSKSTETVIKLEPTDQKVELTIKII